MFLGLSVVLCVLPLFCAILLWYIKKGYYDRKLKGIPGIVSYPLIGSALEFAGKDMIIPVAMKYSKKFRGSYKVMLGFDYFLVVSDYKTAGKILTSPNLLKKSVIYEFMKAWLGNGLIASSGDYWKNHRKIITHTFHFKILEDFLNVFDKAGNILLNKFFQIEDKSSVDISNLISNYAFDILCESAMGTSVHAQDNPESEYLQASKTICRIMIERGLSPLERYDFLYQFSRNYREETRCIKILHEYNYKVIAKRRERLLQEKNNNYETGTADEEIGAKKHKALLDVLLEANVDGVPLTDKEIREEVDTFMFSGHDTTSSAISFTLYCLAQYPKIQEKLVEELKDVFGDDKTRPATHQELQQMKYLELIIKETLRIYPTIPLFGRQLEKDFEFDGITYPAGLNILLVPFTLHRDPTYFPDPDKFNPERFLQENQTDKFPFSYIPFSAGPRNCIGQKYAMLQVKATIAKIIRSFELSPSSDGHKLSLIYETILNSSTGMKIQLKERDW